MGGAQRYPERLLYKLGMLNLCIEQDTSRFKSKCQGISALVGNLPCVKMLKMLKVVQSPGRGETHEDLELGAVTSMRGVFHLPISSGSTVNGRLGQCADVWWDELCGSTTGVKYYLC